MPFPAQTPVAVESHARRAAKRMGLRVCKSRSRTYTTNTKGGFQLVDDRNMVVAGLDYDMTAEDVLRWCFNV